MKKINSVSIVLPAFNEEKIISTIVSDIEEISNKIANEYQIIIVNDGSTDRTGRISDDLASKNKNIKVIHHLFNLGYGEAVKSGFYASEHQWIVLFDSDGQFDFKEISKFFETQEKTDSDIVWGYTFNRKVSIMRKINTYLWSLIISRTFDIKLKWIDCGFRIFRKEVIEKIPVLESGRGAFISSEFLIKAKKYGFKISEVEVNHFSDSAGGSTGANLRVIFRSFIDLIRLYKKIK